MAWSGDEASFQGFINKHSLTFPQISDDPGEVFAHFAVPGQPAFVVVDTDGTTIQELGAVDEEQLNQILTDVTS